MRPTLIEEMMAAGRGVIAIFTGNKRAPDYFDFTLRGLVGSFIAYIVVVTIRAYLSTILTSPDELQLSLVAIIVATSVVLSLQIGLAALLLRQFNRANALLPYIVASNWAAFVLNLVDIALFAAGVHGAWLEIAFLAVGILVTVNVARLVLRLQTWQIVLLVVVDLGAWYFGRLLALSLVLTPEQWEQLRTLANQ